MKKNGNGNSKQIVVKNVTPMEIFELPVEKKLALAKNISTNLLSYIQSSGVKPLAIKGQKYLYNQHWQLIASQFNVTCGTAVEKLENGYKGIATVYYRGQEVGHGEAICINTEKNWQGKDEFTLASMSQTRAENRALKNIFGWIVSLAGYQPTPAEEMSGFTNLDKATATIEIEPELQESAKKLDINKLNTTKISLPQRKRLFALLAENKKTKEELKSFLAREYAIEHTSDIQMFQYDAICDWITSK